jgi:cobalt/nickel transport system ATP-binding protein
MNSVEVTNLSFRYPASHASGHALHSINFKAEKGKIIGLLGENGAGKTTLMKHFNGLLAPDNGKVLIEGMAVTKKTMKEVRRRVGLVFQNPDDQLFSPTVRQDVAFGPMNLGLARADVEKRVERALKLVGMSEQGERAPHELSFGEKKRVCFAGVLAMEPEILVLDEPTANLDPGGIHDILGIVKRLNKNRGITVILATHNINIVPELADDIYVMHHGSVIGQGTPAQIFSDQKLLKHAGLDLPEISKLMVLLKAEGYDVGLPLSVPQAFTELKKILENGHHA